MRHLIIYAHPNENSLNHTLLNTVVETLQSQNQEIVVRDLYKIGFDPVFSLEDMQGQFQGRLSDDVKTEQEHISWAEQITFIYPIWWTGLPAMMKGYIDRVFSYGFAYRYDQGVQKGLLKGKKTIIINTHGKSHEEYEKTGMDKALTLTSDNAFSFIPDWKSSGIYFLIKQIKHLPKIWKSGRVRSKIYTLNRYSTINFFQ